MMRSGIQSNYSCFSFLIQKKNYLCSQNQRFMTMMKLELKVEMGEVRRARAFADSIADDAGLSERQVQNLHLVVEEAVANIVNYSGATMMELSA